MTARTSLLAAALAAGLSLSGTARAADGFDVIALGALGGIEDGNLSAWLVHPHDDNRSVTFDAGTLVNGLRVAEEKGDLDSIKLAPDSRLSRVGYVLTDLIKGYLISHAHLDHVAGLVIASQTGLVVCVIAGGLLLGVLNTVFTESVMGATELPRSVASSAYSAVRFLGGAAAPPLAATLAEVFFPAMAYLVAAASVLVATVIVISRVKVLSRVNGGPQPLPVEAEAIGIGDAG